MIEVWLVSGTGAPVSAIIPGAPRVGDWVRCWAGGKKDIFRVKGVVWDISTGKVEVSLDCEDEIEYA